MCCIALSFACFCIAPGQASTLVSRTPAILGFGTSCSALRRPTLFLGRPGPNGPNPLVSCALVASFLRCMPVARAPTCINPGAWFTMSVLCVSPLPWRRPTRPCCANAWAACLESASQARGLSLTAPADLTAASAVATGRQTRKFPPLIPEFASVSWEPPSFQPDATCKVLLSHSSGGVGGKRPDLNLNP